MRTAIRIVLDPLDLALNIILVATKIDDAITALVASAAMSRRDPAIIVTPARTRLFLDQRLVRRTLVQLRRIDLDRKTAAGRGRSKFL